MADDKMTAMQHYVSTSTKDDRCCPICASKITLDAKQRVRKHGGKPPCPASGFTVGQGKEMAKRRLDASNTWWAAEERARSLKESARGYVGPDLAMKITKAEDEADALWALSQAAVDWRPE